MNIAAYPPPAETTNITEWYLAAETGERIVMDNGKLSLNKNNASLGVKFAEQGTQERYYK